VTQINNIVNINYFYIYYRKCSIIRGVPRVFGYGFGKLIGIAFMRAPRLAREGTDVQVVETVAAKAAE